MFESFNFLGSKPETQGQIEDRLKKVAGKQLKRGVNKLTISTAFRSMMEEVDKMRTQNTEPEVQITNNLILNLLRDEAFAMSDPVDDVMYGGPDRMVQLIREEIEHLRNGLAGEEQES